MINDIILHYIMTYYVTSPCEIVLKAVEATVAARPQMAARQERGSSGTGSIIYIYIYIYVMYIYIYIYMYTYTHTHTSRIYAIQVTLGVMMLPKSVAISTFPQ